MANSEAKCSWDEIPFRCNWHFRILEDVIPICYSAYLAAAWFENEVLIRIVCGVLFALEFASTLSREWIWLEVSSSIASWFTQIFCVFSRGIPSVFLCSIVSSQGPDTQSDFIKCGFIWQRSKRSYFGKTGRWSLWLKFLLWCIVLYIFLIIVRLNEGVDLPTVILL